MAYTYVKKGTGVVRVDPASLSIYLNNGWSQATEAEYNAKNASAQKTTTTQQQPSPSTTPSTTQPSTTNQSTAPGVGSVGQFSASVDPSKRYYLVMFSGDPTPSDPDTSGGIMWLFDSQDKTYRPISGTTSEVVNFLVNGMGIDEPTAMNMFNTAATSNILNPSSLPPNMVGTFLSMDYAPNESNELPPYEPTQVNAGEIGADGMISTGEAGTYGATVLQPGEDGYDSQVQSLSLVSQAIGLAAMKLWQTGQISEETYNKLGDATDTSLLTKYASAGLFGGYTVDDILLDLKIRDLSRTNPAYEALTAVDPQKKASDYHASKSYKDLLSNPSFKVDGTKMSELEPYMGTPLYAVSTDIFKTLVTPIDWSDPATRAKRDSIEAAWYELAELRNNADTEQAKAIADTKFQEFVSNLNETYGWQLSLNAREAWNQMQDIFSTHQKAGLVDTGIHQEVVDRYLADVRRADERVRSSKMTQYEQQWRQQLLEYGSPQEIKEAVAKLDSEDSAKGLSKDQFRSKLWGLVPSDETVAFFNTENLRKLYGAPTQQEIASAQSNLDSWKAKLSQLESSGASQADIENAKSSVNYYDEQVATLKGKASNALTDEQLNLLRNQLVDDYGNYRSTLYQKSIKNAFDLSQGKSEYQTQKLLEQNVAKTQEAYRPFSETLTNYPLGTDVPYQKALEEAGKTTTEADASGKAAALGTTGTLSSEAASKKLTYDTNYDWSKAFTAVPWKSGLADTQINELKAAAQRLGGAPSDYWSNPTWQTQRATDIKNWNYATNNSPVPSPYAGTDYSTGINLSTGQLELYKK